MWNLKLVLITYRLRRYPWVCPPLLPMLMSKSILAQWWSSLVKASAGLSFSSQCSSSSWTDSQMPMSCGILPSYFIYWFSWICNIRPISMTSCLASPALTFCLYHLYSKILSELPAGHQFRHFMLMRTIAASSEQLDRLYFSFLLFSQYFWSSSS